jgi:hypothetical protein
MIAAGLANGFDTADMGLVFIHDSSDEMKFSPALFLMPAFREYARRIAGAPGMLAGIARGISCAIRARTGPSDRPARPIAAHGCLRTPSVERVMARLFSTNGRTNDFRQLCQSFMSSRPSSTPDIRCAS